MNKGLLTIITNAGTEVKDTSTSFATILKTYANNRYFQILRVFNWQNIRADYTLDTVSGTQEYALPDDFAKEISIRDTTNGVELAKSDIAKLITDYPSSYTTAGLPTRYYIREDAVKTQPTSASVVAITSSSASDTTQTVLIRGIVGGVETSESVTVTGTSTANSTNSYTRIKAISKSANTTGFITAKTNGGVVTLAILAPKALTSYYKLLGLHYVPNGVVTLAIPYIVKPLPLTEDYDYPVIEIGDAIEKGVIADAYRYKGMMAKANVFEAQFTVLVNDLIWNKENDPNAVIQFSPKTFDKGNLY